MAEHALRARRAHLALVIVRPGGPPTSRARRLARRIPRLFGRRLRPVPRPVRRSPVASGRWRLLVVLLAAGLLFSAAPAPPPASSGAPARGPYRVQEGDMPTDIATIERDELKARIDRGEPFALVEVLAEPQYRSGHLPGALNIPLGRLRELAPKLLSDRQAEIVVYCGSFTWTASEQAARDLAAMGYTRVREYAGGKQDWMEAGLPLESTEPAPQG